MDSPTALQLVQQWITGLSWPAAITLLWAVYKWVSHKEATFREELMEVKTSLTVLRDNHLAHIQSSLDGINFAQRETLLFMTQHKEDMVEAINNSKDSIVQAIISLK